MDAKRQMPPIVEDGTYDLVTHTRTNARSRTLEHTQTRTHAQTHYIRIFQTLHLQKTWFYSKIYIV